MDLYRMIVPVQGIDAAALFYQALLGEPGERVSGGRHYFDCGATILACLDTVADGDADPEGPNIGHIYLSTTEDLAAVRERALQAGARLDPHLGEVTTHPWGERSFYVYDPWGNPLAVVAADTTYRGGPFR